ncbi:MAG: family 16 glycosylhydrolase [Bacteroidales bacterium]|jgi:beta-glucanase (GH16 family)|nr:family 16 glycosylhydrolase [Bacteroidales bacterium]
MSLLGIKLKLGFFPNAEKIDRQHDALLKEYDAYVAYSQSEELARFEYLNKYLNSPEFEEMENNPDIDRAKIEEVKSEFELLKKSPGLVGYLKSKSQEAKFIPVKSWKLEFEDHFTGDQLDSKWLTRYYWGDKLLKDSYSLPGDQQCNTNGKNIGLSGSKLSILTQREAAKGFSWNPLSGFVFREFPYTSGVINTSKSFRHIYGKVEAKIKVPKGNGYHAFWLAGERMLPQINIFKYTGKKFYLGNFWGNMADPKGIKKDNTKITGAFAGKYCIFTLEWTPKQLQWSINGVVFKTSQRGIPSEPMYIAFGSGVEDDAKLTRPVKLEIDWVRFYSKA